MKHTFFLLRHGLRIEKHTCAVQPTTSHLNLVSAGALARGVHACSSRVVESGQLVKRENCPWQGLTLVSVGIADWDTDFCVPNVVHIRCGRRDRKTAGAQRRAMTNTRWRVNVFSHTCVWWPHLGCLHGRALLFSA